VARFSSAEVRKQLRSALCAERWLDQCAHRPRLCVFLWGAVYHPLSKITHPEARPAYVRGILLEGHLPLTAEAPPSRRVAAERLAGVGGVGAGPRLHVDDADFEDIARLGAADRDRSGADVHAEALARAAAEQLAVDWSGAAAIDALLVLGPQEHTFGARIALDHALGVVIGVAKAALLSTTEFTPLD
jgi:hypothetical protein